MGRTVQAVEERWVKIPGFKYDYRISTIGRCVKIEGEKVVFLKMNYGSKLQKRYRLTREDGKRRLIQVSTLMANAFMGGRKEGMCLYHKNGATSDFSLENLVWLPKKKGSKQFGGQLRKSVEKVDNNGKVLELYRSVTEAAEKNYCNRKAVRARCNGTIDKRNQYLGNGYTFRWELDIC